MTQPPRETTYDPAADAAYIQKFLASGTTDNAVFGVVIHWLVMQDAVRRLQTFLDIGESAPHRVLSSAFPDVSYIWLRRHDKIAQAVSWYKAIQTGTYVGAGNPITEDDARLQFDYRSIRHLLSALTSFENAWEAFFSSNQLTPLVLYYEDLSARYIATVRSVLDFLQLDAAEVSIANPRHEKYADGISVRWIELFKLQHKQTTDRR